MRPTQFSFDDQLAVYIAERVRDFAIEAPKERQWLSPYVDRYRALPLFLGFGETMGITTDGKLVRWSTEGDYEGVVMLKDPIMARTALTQGSKRYPPIASAIPLRPLDAHTCQTCNGIGEFPNHPDIVCTCGGVGWVDGLNPGPGSHKQAGA